MNAEETTTAVAPAQDSNTQSDSNANNDTMQSAGAVMASSATPNVTQAEEELVVHATDSDFDAIIKDGNVVVDFWAAWCGPCQRIAPMVEELAKKYKGKVKFVKLNVDENPEITEQLQVRECLQGSRPAPQPVGPGRRGRRRQQRRLARRLPDRGRG